jgi:hypothetical protein
MNQSPVGPLWQAIRSHPRTTLLFILLWIATWVGTVVTWERDPAGYSVGMSPIAIPFHFVLPTLLGALVGTAWHGTPHGISKAYALVGGAFGAVHFALLWPVDAVWLPDVQSGLSRSEFVAEAVGFALGYTAICVGLGVFGGRLSRVVRSRAAP